MINKSTNHDHRNSCSLCLFAGSTSRSYFPKHSKTMNQQKLTDLAGELGTIFGSFVGFLIVNAVSSAFFYLIIALMIGIPVTYLQVFGVVLLTSWFFKFIKNILG